MSEEPVNPDPQPAPAPTEPEAAAPTPTEPEAAAPVEPAEAAAPSEEAAADDTAAANEPAEPEVTPVEPAKPSNKRWYVVKVQSGREETIKEAIERRVKIEALEEFFGQIVVPVERYIENRNGKRVTRERKLYPGYLMCEVEYNDRILYLFRETSGVGDFVGGTLNTPPPPMPAHEVERMLGSQSKEKEPGIKVAKPKYDRGDRVKVKDGTFAGMEGEVKELLEAKSLVRVELTIFGRPVPVELEYWQVEHS